MGSDSLRCSLLHLHARRHVALSGLLVPLPVALAAALLLAPDRHYAALIEKSVRTAIIPSDRSRLWEVLMFLFPGSLRSLFPLFWRCGLGSQGVLEL